MIYNTLIFPDELQFHILDNIADIRDLGVCSRVCRLWNALVPSTKTWKDALQKNYIKKFQTLPFSALGSHPSTSILEAEKCTQIYDIAFFEEFNDNMCAVRKVLFSDPNLIIIGDKNDGEQPYPLYAYVYNIHTKQQHNFIIFSHYPNFLQLNSSVDDIVIHGEKIFVGYANFILEYDIPTGKKSGVYTIRPETLSATSLPLLKEKVDKMSYVVGENYICSCLNYNYPLENQAGQKLPYTNFTFFSRFTYKNTSGNIKFKKGDLLANKDIQGNSSLICKYGSTQYYINNPLSEDQSCNLVCRDLQKGNNAVDFSPFPSDTLPESLIATGSSFLTKQKNSISLYSLELKHKWTHNLTDTYTINSVNIIKDKIFLLGFDENDDSTFQMLNAHTGHLEAEFPFPEDSEDIGVDQIEDAPNTKIIDFHISRNHLAMIVTAESPKIIIQEFPMAREREAAEDEPQPKRQKAEDLA